MKLQRAIQNPAGLIGSLGGSSVSITCRETSTWLTPVMGGKSKPRDHINGINNIVSPLFCEKLRFWEMLWPDFLLKRKRISHFQISHPNEFCRNIGPAITHSDTNTDFGTSWNETKSQTTFISSFSDCHVLSWAEQSAVAFQSVCKATACFISFFLSCLRAAVWVSTNLFQAFLIHTLVSWRQLH